MYIRASGKQPLVGLPDFALATINHEDWDDALGKPVI